MQLGNVPASNYVSKNYLSGTNIVSPAENFERKIWENARTGRQKIL